MLWFIIIVAAIWGLHHFVKYLMPVLRVTEDRGRWDRFNNRETDIHGRAI